jgi:hypothetical protein
LRLTAEPIVGAGGLVTASTFASHTLLSLVARGVAATAVLRVALDIDALALTAGTLTATRRTDERITDGNVGALLSDTDVGNAALRRSALVVATAQLVVQRRAVELTGSEQTQG